MTLAWAYFYNSSNKIPCLMHSTRFGINSNNHPEYALYKLRSLIELNEPSHPFRAKSKVVLDYMIDNNIEPIPDNIRKILGSNSNWIIEQMKSKALPLPMLMKPLVN